MNGKSTLDWQAEPDFQGCIRPFGEAGRFPFSNNEILDKIDELIETYEKERMEREAKEQERRLKLKLENIDKIHQKINELLGE